MNFMDKVCEMLGVSLFEKFNITQVHPCAWRKIDNPYYFTDEGLMNKYGVLDNIHLADLICGALKVEKLEPENFWTKVHHFEYRGNHYSMTGNEIAAACDYQNKLYEQEGVFGRVSWNKEDLVKALTDEGYEPTEDNIDTLYCEVANNDDMQDAMISAGWDVLSRNISELERRGELSD